jgi:hypothetical protein
MENNASDKDEALSPESQSAKAAILAECDRLGAGVTFVAVHFDGYGDDGTTEDVKCYDNEWYAWGEHEPVKFDASHLQEHFESLVPFGYENDCGGFGDVVLDVRLASCRSSGTIALRITRPRRTRFSPMAHPLKHAQSSARKFGGKAEDYLPIHNWFDESKAFLSDFRHRALRHHAEGIFLAEKLFGIAIVNSDGKQVPVRYVGEQHFKEDLCRIPTAQDWLLQVLATFFRHASGNSTPVISVRTSMRTGAIPI